MPVGEPAAAFWRARRGARATGSGAGAGRMFAPLAAPLRAVAGGVSITTRHGLWASK
ncbi:MAG: hypothetical protein ACRDPA_11355 [Solirubrobacteraceae bacterium]